MVVIMSGVRWIILGLFLISPPGTSASDFLSHDEFSPALPRPGDCQLRCLSPLILELTLITTKPPDPAPLPQWNFVGNDGQLHPPAANEFVVTVAGTNCSVIAVGFKRRVIYAPLKKRDLRIGNFIYLKLARPISENQRVEVANPDGRLWPGSTRFASVLDPLRWSPAIHVNQVGFLPEGPKKAMVGYFLGSLGEMVLLESPSGNAPPGETEAAPIPSLGHGSVFDLIEARTGRKVFHGLLKPRPDRGFPFPAYQRVLEADFS